jgi:hypothetical protein
MAQALGPRLLRIARQLNGNVETEGDGVRRILGLSPRSVK